jgi:hypothetical protein
LDFVRAIATCDWAFEVRVRGSDIMPCGVVVRPVGGVAVRDAILTIGASGTGVLAGAVGAPAGAGMMGATFGGATTAGGVRVRGIATGGADDGLRRRG